MAWKRLARWLQRVENGWKNIESERIYDRLRQDMVSELRGQHLSGRRNRRPLIGSHCWVSRGGICMGRNRSAMH